MSSPYPQRARGGGGRLVLLLVALTPLLELLCIIAVGQWIGGWATLGLLLLQGVAGMLIARAAGSRAWVGLREASRTGRSPQGLSDAVIRLLAGILLAFPGFLTDIPALLLLLPFTRPAVKGLAEAAVARRLFGRVTVVNLGRVDPTRERRSPGGGATDEVIEGEIVDEGP